jgi:hypothetical protein
MTTTDDPRARHTAEESSELPRHRPYVHLPAGGQASESIRMPRFTPKQPAPEAAEAARPAPRPAVERPGAARPASSPAGHDGRVPRRPAARRAPAARAVIGDEIRIPIMWCQFGSCIARYTHHAALGERDLRARALAAGWRYDALGRLACPDCVQRDPAFWPTRAPVPATGRWHWAG